MRFLFYTHSLVSDWNHGNAHFQRGVMTELNALGFDTLALEPSDSWSRTQLEAEHGAAAVRRFHDRFPHLKSIRYDRDFDHEQALDTADVVIVHEWTDPALVARIGRARRDGGRFRLVFHDTHHRAASADREIAGLDLKDFDLVLAFGESITERYRRAGWGKQVATWHEAADTNIFRPMAGVAKSLDLIWVGNWGDGERGRELEEFLIDPARRLGLRARIHGVRYPDEALAKLKAAGIDYAGWLANAEVPSAFATAKATVHVPRRPYVQALPGIPTIRVFEALACGIPLICAPWNDSEGLFRPGRDYLTADDGASMTRQLELVLSDEGLAQELARSGLETILARHTCRHRVDQLLDLLGIAAERAEHRSEREAAE